MFVDEKKIGESRVALEPWRQILLAAADYIEKHGWCTHRARDERGRVCAIGGINSVSRGCENRNKISIVARMKFRNYLVDCGYTVYPAVSAWNDSYGQTKENVISTMRDCARKA
jgi:hypothetical protein